jgi:hypothetical protein
MKRFSALIGTCLLTVLPAVPARAQAQPDNVVNGAGQGSHRVVGTGTAEEEGIVFTTTLYAIQKATGEVDGVVAVVLDLRAVGVPDPVTFLSDVTCMDVAGNRAWIGSTVSLSSNEEVLPVGTTIITYIRDLGGPGKDIMHGEPFDPSVSCGDRPDLSQTVVSEGNFQVR